MAEPLRIALISTVTPVVGFLVPALRDLGHEPVAIISARRPVPAPGREFPELSDSTAPPGLDVLIVRDKWSMEPLLRACRSDLAVCWGFPWRIPLSALEVPPLGSINLHPAMLPRHRGPIPVSWAIRDGDGQYGLTWHRMDAELDTGGILAQATVPMQDDDFDYQAVGPRLTQAALQLRRASSSGSRQAIRASPSPPRAPRGPAFSTRTTPRSTGRGLPGRSTTRLAPGRSPPRRTRSSDR